MRNFAVFLGLTIAGSGCFADDIDLSGDEALLFQDIPSVLGASKYEQRATEAPAAVSIVTAEEIHRYGYRDLGEVLSSVRGLYTSYDQAYTYLGVRGFLRPGDYNSRVLLLIDGYKTNDNLFEQAFIGNEAAIPVDLIDRVEVIRGASSSLYGTNAFFAVINVITKKGRDFNGTELAATAGSYGRRSARATYGNKNLGEWETVISASGFARNGRDVYYSEFDDPATNNGVAGGVDEETARKLFFSAHRNGTTIEAWHVARHQYLPTGVFGTAFNDRTTEIDDPQLSSFTVSQVFDVDDQSSVTTRLGFNDYRYQGTYLYPDYLDIEDDKGKWWTGEAWLSRRTASEHTWIAGVDYQYNAKQYQKSYDVLTDEIFFLDERSSSNWAGYIQDEFRITSRWLANIGVRYDHDANFGGTTNPRAALIYLPLSGTSIKFLAGRAFRAPNVYELFYNDGGVSQKAPDNLEPETITSYEFVMEHELRPRFRGLMSLYAYRVDKLINITTDPADDLLIFENLDDVKAHGFEVELEGTWWSRIEGRVSYALQRATASPGGERLENSPASLLKANFSAPLASENLTFGLEGQYVSGRKTVQGNVVDGFAVVNATLMQRMWSGRADVSFGVYNTFDKTHFDPTSDGYVQDAIPQSGRTYRVKLRVELR